jgi:hypothetical protein
MPDAASVAVEPILDLEHTRNRPLARHFVTSGVRVAHKINFLAEGPGWVI